MSIEIDVRFAPKAAQFRWANYGHRRRGTMGR